MGLRRARHVEEYNLHTRSETELEFGDDEPELLYVSRQQQWREVAAGVLMVCRGLLFTFWWVMFHIFAGAVEASWRGLGAVRNELAEYAEYREGYAPWLRKLPEDKTKKLGDGENEK